MRRRVVVAALAAAAVSMVAASPAVADSGAWVDDDDNPAIMQEVADALADVETLFGTPLVAETGWMRPGYFAVARGRSIVVNKVWSTGSYDALNEAIAADVAVGHHNGGCTGARAVALHEAGHVIANLRGGVAERRLAAAVGAAARPDLAGRLSGYSFDPVSGAVNPQEAVAEAFQAVMCGSDGPEEREIYGMLVN